MFSFFSSIRFHLILCTLIAGFPLRAQQLFVQRYPASTYKGATQNWEIAQDEQGTLFFANNDGLLTYNGKHWNLTPTTNKEFVFSLALDSKDRVYVSSLNELGYFERDSTFEYRYTSLLPKLPKAYHNFKYMNEIKVFHDTVFYVDSHNIYQYANDNFTVIQDPNVKLFNLDNTLYLLKKEGFSVYKNSSFQAIESSDTLKFLNAKWAGAYRNASFLLLDDKNGLWRFDPAVKNKDRLTFITPVLDEYLKDVTRFKMKSLDNGNFVILTAKNLTVLDQDMNLLYNVSSESVGEKFTTPFLFEDVHHNVWVTTNSSIVQVITSSPLSYFDKHNGLNGVVLSMGKKDQHSYVGTNTGIYYRDNKTSFSELPNTSGEAWNFYNFHNTMYVAHRTGVFQLEGKKVIPIISHTYVHSLCQLKGQSNKMILGSFNSGIWLLRKDKNTWTKKKIHGFEEETRFMHQDDDGSIWISHYNKGIYKLRLNAAMDSVIETSFYDQRNGLPSHLNNRLYRLKNNKVIVTTVSGVYEFDNTKDRFVSVDDINNALGKNFCIYSIGEADDCDDIYFYGGMAQQKEYSGVLQKQNDGSYKVMITPFYKTAASVRELRVDVDAPILCISQDEVWIGNKVNLISYNPKQKTFFDESFYTYIQQVTAGDSSILNYTTTLPYALNSLRLSFTSNFFENPERVEYQYQLIGFQPECTNWTAGNEAVFTNLPHGKYTFSVRARNVYGTISEPDTFSFTIRPPWYNTSWAFLLYAASLIAFVFVAIRLNTKRIREQKLKLEKKVRKKTKELRARNKEISDKGKKIARQAKELKALNVTKDKLFSIVSHDLRGPIKQVQVILNLIETKIITQEDLKSFMPQLKESVEHTVNLTDNLLQWANSQMAGIHVKPSRINLKEIAEENYQIFKPLAEGKKIDLKNSITSDLFVFADKDMIKLVVRNLLNNALKFSDSGSAIRMDAEENQKHIKVSVQDTGIGMTHEQQELLFTKDTVSEQGTFGEKGVGLGLILCYEFLEKNKGSIQVVSKIGEGSKFTFKLPKDEH